jgi:hypothetical protein
MEGLPPLILRWITGRERGTGWTSMVKSEIVPQLVYGGDKYSMPMQAVATGDSRAPGDRRVRFAEGHARTGFSRDRIGRSYTEIAVVSVLNLSCRLKKERLG